MSEIQPCPACGAEIEVLEGPISATRDFQPGEVTSHSRQTRECPSCLRKIVRHVLPGSPWTLVE